MKKPRKGKLYTVTHNGVVLPNKYKFVRTEPLHCQLHGEWYGTAWIMVRRRNSETRPWGSCLHRFDSSTTTLEPCE